MFYTNKPCILTSVSADGRKVYCDYYGWTLLKENAYVFPEFDLAVPFQQIVESASGLSTDIVAAVRSEPPPSPHDSDDPSEISCMVCKGHARLGSVLPTTRVQTLDSVEARATPATVEERVPGLVSRLDSRPRAPPGLAS